MPCTSHTYRQSTSSQAIYCMPHMHKYRIVQLELLPCHINKLAFSFKLYFHLVPYDLEY